MFMARSSSSSSSKSFPPTPPPHQSPLFTSNQECDREEQEDTTPSVTTYKGLTPKHFPTPKSNSRKRPESGGSGCDGGGGKDGSVSCNKCRTNSREKISVVPFE